MARRHSGFMILASASLAASASRRARGGGSPARQEPHPGRHRRDDAGGEGPPRHGHRHGVPRPAPGHAGAGRRRDEGGRPGRRRDDVRHSSPGDSRHRRGGRSGRPSDPAAARGGPLAHVLLHGVSHRDPAGVDLGRRPRRARRPRDGERDPGVRRRRHARPRPQHPPQPPRGPELRVLLGGSPGLGPDGRRHGEGCPVPGCRHVPEALRRQQPRVEPQHHRREGLPEGAARDLPARLRDRGPGVAAVDGHVLVQQDQRHLHLGEPRAADGRPAGRLAVRRAGDDRLVRRAGRGGADEGRERAADAGHGAPAEGAPRRPRERRA